MKDIIRRFLAWLNGIRDEFEDNRRLHQSAYYWEKAGALEPYAAAEEERYLRLKLEEFRRFASDRYLEDPSLTRDAIKEEWLKGVVKTMAGIPQCRESAKALKVAVMACGDEMFIGDAARARRDEIKTAIANARKDVAAIKTGMRHRALKR